MFVLTFLCMHLFVRKLIFKPLAAFIFIASSFCLYFMKTYGIFIDPAMIQNTVETHTAESLDLINLKLLTYILLYGLLPCIILTRIKIQEKPFLVEIKNRLTTIVIGAVVVILLILPFSKDYLALSRNHRELRYLYNPSNYVYSSIIFTVKSLKDQDESLIHIGDDAVQTNEDINSSRKRAIVLVVGETARASSFSLLGYERETNPNLAKEDIVTYSKATSCGTSTAISVPCMFSHLGRKNGGDGNKAKKHENLLDVLNEAGIHTTWRENNSGCKGVCDRSTLEPAPSVGPANLCTDGHCQDEVLLDHLKEKINAATEDTLIVLHTQGSHGPAYFKRYPKEFDKFKPTCNTSNIETCSNEEIQNTYDNTILYTDYFLTNLIGVLKETSATHDTMMIYASDHGESLGENHLYLHGSPYFIAPDEQVHIPIIAWLSEPFQKRANISTEDLKKNKDKEISHDNIYQTILGAFKVETNIYNPDLDLFTAKD